MNARDYAEYSAGHEAGVHARLLGLPPAVVADLGPYEAGYIAGYRGV